jgi:hypothetical protein
MIYVFDNDALITLFRYYYPTRFPSLWDKFEKCVRGNKIISVREVYNEIEGHSSRLGEWVKEHRDFFYPPSSEKLAFVADIFRVPHFQDLVRKQERLQGKPVADPFVIAKAKVANGCVITQESRKPNAVHIPNVCDHFSIHCLNLEGFMEREDWTF